MAQSKQCTVEGCDGQSKARGWCSMHYYRWKRNGDPLKVLPSHPAQTVDPTWTKVCVQCGNEYHPGTSTAIKQWERRQFCDTSCANRYRALHSEGAGARFKGGHGASVTAGMASSPWWIEARARRDEREAQQRAKRAAEDVRRRMAKYARAQTEMWPRTCRDCMRPIGKGAQYCEACDVKRKRERRDRWNREHPDYNRIYKRAYKAMIDGVIGRCTEEQSRARYDYYGGACAYCLTPLAPFDETPRSWHWDHVIALSRGGTNWPANLRPSCAPCNQRKCAQPLSLFTGG